MATWKGVGSANGKATGTTLVSSPGGGSATVAVGDVVVVAFADIVGGTAPTISDALGNTWTALTGPTTNTVRCNKWYSIITVAGTMTVTVSFQSSAAARAMVWLSYDGNQVTTLDKNPVNVNDSTTPWDCPSSGVLSQAAEVAIGFLFINGPTASITDATAPFTLEGLDGTSGGNVTTNVSVAICDLITSATTAVAPQFTGTSRTGVVGTATFRYTAPVYTYANLESMGRGMNRGMRPS